MDEDPSVPRGYPEQTDQGTSAHRHAPAGSYEPATFSGIWCTKGLDVCEVRPGEFEIRDALGNTLAPFEARDDDVIIASLKRIANVQPLASRASGLRRMGRRLLLGLADVPHQLDSLYVAVLPDLYRIWRCGRGDWRKYDALIQYLPVAYLEWGYGDGSKEALERIHSEVLTLINAGQSPVTQEILLVYLSHLHFRRICDDIL